MCARSTDAAFFRRKRPWSLIKDQVIGQYMPPYLSKVSRLGKKIVLVDAFAGQGVFEDKTGIIGYGSPVVMCQEAEKHAKPGYTALLFNQSRKHHMRLTEVLESFGIPKNRARPMLGNSRDLLRIVHEQLRDETVLLYLDPFGLQGCEFETIKPFLERSTRYSTEAIINLCVPALYRLAGKRASHEGRTSPQVLANQLILTHALGGEWWKDILWNALLSAEKQAQMIVEEYTRMLKQYLPYAGFCPVKEGATLKYYITFCSRHIDAMTLHNDTMCKAYNKHMVKNKWPGPMFEGAVGWEDNRPYNIQEKLETLVLEKVSAANLEGERPSRRAVWETIVTEPGNFMQFLASEFVAGVKELYKRGALGYIDIRGTKRLNDESRLFIPQT